MASTRCHGAFLGSSLNGFTRGSRPLVRDYRSYGHPCRQSTTLIQSSEEPPNTCSPPLSDLPEDPRERALHAFSVLAKRDRSWQRFRHMVDLAVDHHQQTDAYSIRSVTDVGTDHGLLAVGLALSGRFDSVLGVDVSPNALENGGFQLLDKVQDFLISDSEEGQSVTSSEKNTSTFSSLPLDFRLSDGLRQVKPGEADAVCIAGMGVKVIGKILEASSSDDSGILEVDRLNCQQLILQPTNSRPRNLIQLYDMLQRSGWSLLDERIEFLSRRWYLSSCFVRTPANDDTSNITASQESANLPTSKLALLDETDPMKIVTRDYWRHHLNWIKNEEDASGGNLHRDDIRWRDWVLIRPLNTL
jgi:tRNA A22 N-methylase